MILFLFKESHTKANCIFKRKHKPSLYIIHIDSNVDDIDTAVSIALDADTEVYT